METLIKGIDERGLPLVSVVVPIYNTGKYLSRCLDSIIDQSYKKLEILLVDDGSTDDSPDIIKHYKKVDDRVKVINRLNGGLSAARNSGLNASTGEYICFIDSDDSIHSSMIATLFRVLNENNADFARCDLRHIKQGDVVIEESSSWGNKGVSVLDSPFEDFVAFRFWPSVCHTLYKRDAIGELRFTEGIVHEDLDFTYRFLLRTQRGVYIPWPGYNYFYTPGSITRSGYSLRKLRDLDFILRNLFSLYQNQAHRRLKMLRIRVLAPICKEMVKTARRAAKAENKELCLTAKKYVSGLVRDGIVRISDLSPRWWLSLVMALMQSFRSEKSENKVI